MTMYGLFFRRITVLKLSAGMVYDAIVALVILLTLWRGWRQGVLSELVRLLGWVAAVVLISMYVGGWAERIYASFLEPKAVTAVAEAIPPDMLSAMESGAVAVESLQEVLNSLRGFFGGQVVDQATVDQITALLRQDAGSLAQIITQTVLRPVLLTLVQAVLSILLLAACLTVSKLLARLVAARRSDGIGSMTNRLLGAALGFGEGLVTAYIFVFVLSLLAVFFSNSVISQATLQNTRLVRLFL